MTAYYGIWTTKSRFLKERIPNLYKGVKIIYKVTMVGTELQLKPVAWSRKSAIS
jgi:hypothetical protein